MNTHPASDLTQPLLRWLAAHDLPPQVVLLCEHTPVPAVSSESVVVRVPGCLAEVSIGLPAQLLAWGVPAVSAVACNNAPDDVRRHVEQWRATIPTGLDLVEEPPQRRRWRRSPEVLHLNAVPVSRRTLLGLGALDDHPLNLDADDAARTLAALDILRTRGQAVVESENSEPHEAPENSQARALQVSGCTACGVCVQACPHDALQLVHAGTSSTLTHARDACRGELACVQLCPVDAISEAGLIPLPEVWQQPATTLAVVESTRCPRCKARHTGAPGSFCTTCEFRSKNAFGSSLPLGAIAQLANESRQNGRHP